MPGLGHIAIGVAAGRLYSREEADVGSLAASMVAFSVLSVLPDADVVAFAFNIPYEAPFGHRGASHSVVGGLALGVLVGAVGKLCGLAWGRLTCIACLVVVSHGLFDTFTDGGRGVAVLWPFSNERFFAPWRPVPVSPIGPAVFSEWGKRVFLTELVIFLPLLLYAFWPRRRQRTHLGG